MVILVSELFVDDGICHRDRDEEMRLEVVSERSEVAGPPMHRREATFGFFLCEQLWLLLLEGDANGRSVLA